MANKLKLSNEVKELKVGKTFGRGEGAFHTFRYDFMPASLDTSKRAILDVGESHQVTVTVPHIEGSGTSSTVFKGSKKPYQKECVLIIDHATGEITLEKLSYNVQLKKTRAEGSSKVRSSTPTETNFPTKKSPQKLSPQQKTQSTFGRSSPIQKCSPLPKSPIGNLPSPPGNSNHSMPSFSAIAKGPLIPETLPPSNIKEDMMIDAPEVGLLSSSSSSASSGSEESDDSSSDNEEMPEAPRQQTSGIPNGFVESPIKKEPMLSLPTSNNLSMPTANSLPSMPKFSQLSEDLKLSESDSDSDD